MLKIALTGGIATGKSYVLDRLRERGVPCLDADVLAHGVMAPGGEASQAVAARFGADILDEAGRVDRDKLGRIVFADPAARRDLEAIVHPGVYRAIGAGIRAFELVGSSPVVVVDVPLLYETGRSAEFDRVVATVCPPEMQVARLVQRGLTEVEARQRLAAQLPAAEKAARAHQIIDTAGSYEDTDRQVDEFLQSLRV
jgi:dephospho-CoA kinase